MSSPKRASAPISGAEKFFDIKCRKAQLKPSAAVLVATVRALKMHGGVAKDALSAENLPALEAGLANLARHIANLRKFGMPVTVAVNRFETDSATELAFVENAVAREFAVKTIVCDHWAGGGAGAEGLAHVVAALADAGEADFRPLYGDEMSLWDKTRTIAQEIYGAADIAAEASVRAKFRELESAGWGRLPICVAKTQYSFSDDPSLIGAPSGHVPRIRDVRLRAGAGFVVVLMGDVQTMPGLPRTPPPRGFALSTARSMVSLKRLRGFDAHRGGGASSRSSFSVFSARHSAAGSFAFIIAAFRLTSLARCAPAMTLTTAG